jgi:hypothetical protein
MANRWTAHVDSDTLTDCETRLSATERRFGAIEEEIAALQAERDRLDDTADAIDEEAKEECAAIVAEAATLPASVEWRRDSYGAGSWYCTACDKHRNCDHVSAAITMYYEVIDDGHTTSRSYADIVRDGMVE